MRRSNMIKRVTICSLATLMCTGANVFAHTGVRDAADEAKTSYNAFTITHGCGGDAGDPLKVYGQSAVFPFGDGAVWTDLSTNEVIDTGGAGIIDGDTISLSPGGIHNDDPFGLQEEETDSLGNVRALNWRDPNRPNAGLPTNLVGTPEFRVSTPTITDNCVSALRVRIAVANWCEVGQNQASDTDNNRADWWFPVGTGSTAFIDPELLQATFWTTLTVNNPGASTDTCGGPTHEVAVQPGGGDIDEFLPYAPFTADPAPY